MGKGYTKDPNQIGTVFINEGTGRGAGNLYFGGKIFDIGYGVTADLIPFEYEKDGKTVRGWNVIKIADAAEPEETQA